MCHVKYVIVLVILMNIVLVSDWSALLSQVVSELTPSRYRVSYLQLVLHCFQCAGFSGALKGPEIHLLILQALESPKLGLR